MPFIPIFTAEPDERLIRSAIAFDPVLVGTRPDGILCLEILPPWTPV